MEPVEIPKNKIFWSFGARFQIEKAVINRNKLLEDKDENQYRIYRTRKRCEEMVDSIVHWSLEDVEKRLAEIEKQNERNENKTRKAITSGRISI